MSTFLYRLGRNAARHPFRVIGLWVLIALLAVFAKGAAGGEASDKFTIPGVESQRAQDLLQDRFASETHAAGDMVLHVESGTLADPIYADGIADTLGELATIEHVSDVSDPFDARGPTVSADGRTALVTIGLDVDDVTIETVAAYEAAAEHARAAGVTAELTSSLTQGVGQEPGGAEVLGMGVAAIVLLLAFGSVIAMGLPIGTALFGIFVGSSSIGVLMAFTDMPEVASMIAMMVGLGVGIDYALFIVTRHRQHLHAGITVSEAAGRANATAGQAVVFAGSTVVVAILGLQLAGLPAVAAMGMATAVVVLFSVLVAITLLPAFLGLAGTKIDKLRVPGIRQRDDHHNTVSGRWADHVGSHPVRYAIASLLALGLLAVPVLSLRMGFANDSNMSTTTTERRAYDLVADGFGEGFNGPLVIVLDLGDGASTTAVARTEAALAATPGIVSVDHAIYNDTADVALITATPATSSQDEATGKLVRTLRDELPTTLQDTGATVLVGGETAAMIDMSDRVAERLPLFISVVLVLSFLLLMVMFRSILVPLKAALMNLLSIGAAYGVVVAVFQWGWAKGLVGIETTMPVNPLVPLIMFAILFGLSMDYEVFLLSRVREEFLKHGDSHRAVVDGLGSTARVITSAALIMISVFGAFILDLDVVAKMFGLGLATAVLIDATLVRMVLVPATMSLLGKANWWLPAWLDRILPDLDLEGGAPEPAIEPVPDAEPEPDAERELVLV
jgi:RND superfamily putative drug exporter